MKPFLVGLDFDNTIASENTDLIASGLYTGPPEPYKDLKKLYQSGIPWADYMGEVFKLLHSTGIARETLINSIKNIPPVPGFPELMKNLVDNNCEIIIISDSNSVFIETWLKHHSLDQTVAKVFTNPAWFDDDGLLHAKAYRTQDQCKLDFFCKFMCKGFVLNSYIKQRSEEGITFKNIAYAGDGRNDFCPMLNLSQNNLAFPRQEYPIMKYLNNVKNYLSDQTVKAEIHPWKDGDEIWNVLNGLISSK